MFACGPEQLFAINLVFICFMCSFHAQHLKQCVFVLFSSLYSQTSAVSFDALHADFGKKPLDLLYSSSLNIKV